MWFTEMTTHKHACLCHNCPFTATIFILLFSIAISSNLESSLFVRLPSFDGYLHKTYNLTALSPVKSKVACASTCMKDLECGSFFFLQKPQKMCQTHSVLFLTTNEATPTPSASYYQLTQARCPYENGFILYRPVALCYRYIQTNLSWEMAKQNCVANHTHLVDVKTPNISDHLTNFLRASSVSRQMHVSIGGSNISNIWTWSDGSPATWTNWAQNEPNLPEEKCMCMAWFFTFQWNNVPCTGTHPDLLRYYICQLDIP